MSSTGEAATAHVPRGLYYDGQWHEGSARAALVNPGTGESLGTCAVASAEDVDRAAQAAHPAPRLRAPSGS